MFSKGFLYRVVKRCNCMIQRKSICKKHRPRLACTIYKGWQSSQNFLTLQVNSLLICGQKYIVIQESVNCLTKRLLWFHHHYVNNFLGKLHYNDALTLHHTIQTLNDPENLETYFENIVEKGENVGNQHFLLCPQCFFFVSKTNFWI